MIIIRYISEYDIKNFNSNKNREIAWNLQTKQKMTTKLIFPQGSNITLSDVKILSHIER